MEIASEESIESHATDGDGPDFAKERPRWQTVSIDALYPLTAFVLAIGGWAAFVHFGKVKSYLLPSPQSVFTTMIEQRLFLWEQTQVTLAEIVYGFVIAVVVGIFMAILISASPLIEKSVYPLLVASQVIPKVALAPLFLIWLGFGIASKIVIVILISFFPIVVNGVIGLQSLEQEKVYLAQSMGASKWSTFWRIRFPQSLPSLFGGIKLASIFAVVGAVVGEFIGAEAGLGRTLLQAQVRLNSQLLYATIGYLTIVGISIYVVVDIVERLAIPWHISKRKGAVGL